MNGRERIDAAMRGDRPDRVPVMLHNFMPAAREAGFTMAEYRWDARKMAEAHLRAVETYGHDGILLDVDTVTLAEACGVPVSFPEHQAACPTGQCRLHLLEDLPSLPAPDLNNHPRVQTWLEAASLLVERVGGDVYVRGNCDQAPFGLASMIRTPEKWMIDLLTEGAEPLCEDLLHYCTHVTCRFVRLMAATGVPMVSNGDSPAGPSMISPDMYRRWALPYEKRVVAAAHERGCQYVLHICGDTSAILRDMVTTGADGLELDYLTDARLARDALAGRAAFLGNLDPSGVLARGTPALVAERTRELLETFADTPGFILNTGCALPANTPPENIHAMVRTAREFHRD
ncbi:MAG TPA: uroporphyrinogen decarboxylase family protein [Phycisphaerae bacterium]|nr:uroporphyrinogen decarboxylase family protein [Phycisphaerae bacterium]